MSDLRNYEFTEVVEIMNEIGEKKFRAEQIFSWLHQKNALEYNQMSNISNSLKEKLEDKYPLTKMKIAQKIVSSIDGTTKYLFELFDGNIIESVFMIYKHGNSICISTQVGCRMGCKFCASTLDGRVRNLEAFEMLLQIYLIAKDQEKPISNIVLMGSGEPLDNYENVVKFIRLITDSKGMNISVRNITLSTCGLVDKIYQLADEKLPVTLAISLHASDNEVRKELMPIANKYSIEEILKACEYYFKKSGRRLTFEYSLVYKVNDSDKEAIALAKLLKNINCHVNLIPVNPIKERDYKQSSKASIENFKNKLEKYKINVTIRREMGTDIQGACGQLRKSYIKQQNEKEEGDT